MCHYVYLPPSPTHCHKPTVSQRYKFSFPFHSPKLSIAKIFVADSEFCRQYFFLQTVRLRLHLAVSSVFFSVSDKSYESKALHCCIVAFACLQVVREKYKFNTGTMNKNLTKVQWETFHRESASHKLQN